MNYISRLTGERFSLSEAEQEFCRINHLPLRDCTAHERLRQILCFRSSPRLFQLDCAITGKKVISWVPPNSGYSVYHPKHEDELNAERYARPYDFRRGFFEQFA